MRPITIAMFAVLAGIAAGLTAHAQPAGLPPAVEAGMQAIDPQRIRTHVRFLADDLLEGRGTGTRGGDIAARYMAAQFALAGLKPAGDGGDYYQKVGFVGVQTEGSTRFALQPQQGDALELKLLDDYVASNQTQAESADIDAPVVFVGYGIDAPEYQWNDYRDVDVRGKAVLLFVNEPPSKDPKFFNGDALTYYGRWTYKFEEAARRGAVAALIIHRTDLASYSWDVVRSSWSNEQVYLAGDGAPKLQAAAWVQLEVARLLFDAAGLKLEDQFAAAGQRGFKPLPLPLRLKAHVVSKVRNFESANVLAMLPGTDAAAPQQALLYTAHYDHLGMDPNLPGDNIYHGAVDNGTGCGILLELARAFAEAHERPPHPVIFAAVTAEEKGLLGSRYLGEHPPLPAAQISLDLNYDAVQPLGQAESITVSGAERTDFLPQVQTAAAAQHLAIEPDANPAAGHYYRSDHFSLARVGVPAFSINTGVKFAGHNADWGRAQEGDYVARRYHRPADVYAADMDFESDAQMARFGFALGWRALLAAQPVHWLAGDEFAALRGGKP